MEKIINLNVIPEEMLSDEIYAKVLENANWNIQGGKRNYSDFKNLLYYTCRFLRRENSDLLNEFVVKVRKSFKLVDHDTYATASENPLLNDISTNIHFDGYSFEVRDEVELLQLLQWCEDFKQNYDKEHPKSNLPKVKNKGENLEIMDTILNNLVFPKKQEDFDKKFSHEKGIAYLNRNCHFIYQYLLESKNEKKLDAFRKLINSQHFIIRKKVTYNAYGEEEIIGYNLECKSRTTRKFIKNYYERIRSKTHKQAQTIQNINKDIRKLIDTLEEEDELTK